MDYQAKSKDELINELQQLQREHETLKAFCSTSINELRQSERLLQDIIAKNPMSIQIIDKDGFTVLINSAHTKLFGAVPPHNYSVFTDPLLFNRGFSEQLKRAKAGEVVLFPDFYYNVHDLFSEFPDVPVWIRMIIFPLFDKSGKPERYVLMHENITEQRKVENALRESEENYRTILELAPEAFFQGNNKGDIIMTNEKASVLTGFSRDELLRKNMKDFFAPSILNQKPLRYDLLDKGETVIIERDITCKDGRVVTVEMSSRKMPNNTYQSFMRDISEQIKSQQALLESERLYRAIFENTGTSSIIIEDDTIIALANSEWVNLTGYSREEMEGKMSWTQFVVPEDLERMKSYHKTRRTEEEGAPRKYEFRFVRRNGEVRNMINCVAMIPESKRSIASLMDITERKKAEDTLKLSEEKFKTIIETSPDGIAISSLDGKIQFLTQKTASMWGYSDINKIEGRNIMEFVHPDYQDKAKYFVDEMLNGNLTGAAEYLMVRKDGSMFYCESNANILHNAKGEPVGILFINRDITQRKDVENELIKAKEIAEESEKKYRLVFENAPLGIIHYNKKGEIVSCNEEFVRIIGSSKQALEGLNMLMLPDKKITEAVEMALSGGLGHYEDYYHSFTANKITPVQVLFAPIYTNQKLIGGVGIIQDITDRKKSEQALKEQNEEYLTLNEELLQANEELYKAKNMVEKSEETLRLMLKNSNDTFVLINENGEQFYISDAATRDTGYSVEELKGPIQNVIYPDDLELVLKAWKEVVAKKGAVIRVQYRHIHKFKDYIWYEAVAQNYLDNPLIKAVVVNVRDITAMKEFEMELIKAKEKAEENEAKYSNIVKILPDGIVIHTAGKIVFMNDAALKIVKGRCVDDYIGKPAINFVHPDYRELAQERIKNSFVDKRFAEIVEEIFIDNNNNPVRVLVAGSPFKYQGQPSMLTVFTDITKIKETEQELIRAKEKAEENEMKFRVLVETSPDVIVLTDIEGRQIFRNAAYYESLGFSVDENIPLDGFARVHPEDIPIVKESMKQLMSQGIMKGEYRVLHKNGHWVYRQTIAKIINNERNEPHQILTIIRDITDNKMAEQELIKAKEKAEESDRLKTAFLANMSHEIRTPMNGIMGFAELLKRPQLTGEQQQEYIKIIEKSGARMLNIINDIIDISKIESGEAKAVFSPTNINEQLDFIIKFFKPEAEQKGLSIFIAKKLPSEQVTINTDREKVYAILTNLVKNALKFTEKGTIEIGYYSKASFLEFYVKDTGIGIPKNRQNAVFDRFVQADISDSRAFQGAGLGLSIAKAYVEMLGGNIWFQSDEGSGTVFYFTIPYVLENRNVVMENEEIDFKSQDIRTLKVLIAEDDEASDFLMTLMFNNYNCELLHANTGKKAVSICQSNPDLDLIMMDIKMPEMNGHEAVKLIRQFNKDVVIIAQTAHALSGDKEKAIDVGCNDYITKPIKKELFEGIMSKYFSI